MTTNQTIDGVLVSRELLRRTRWELDAGTPSIATLAELRALLDAPACKTCNGTRIVSDGAMHCSSGGIPFESGPIECVKDCPDCKPAAQPQGDGVNWKAVAGEQKGIIEKQQNLIASLRAELSDSYRVDEKPQGEPVAWQRKSKNEVNRWFFLPDSDVEEAIRLGYEVRKLYAEQPAPVAVVMPERKHVPDFTQHPMLAKEYTGWNACLDQLKRLNPSL